MPGLYDAQASTLVRESLQHIWAVEYTDQAGNTIPVETKTCELTMDETWLPYVQGQITAVIPDQATLDRLDPRRIVKVTVKAGYVLPDGHRDLHDLAVAYLSGRSVDRPSDEVVMSIQGQEYVFARHLGHKRPGGAPATWSIADQIQAHKELEVRWAVGFLLADMASVLFGIGANTGWDFDHASNRTGWSGGTLGQPATDPERYGHDTLYLGANTLNTMLDIANLTGCRLYCDEKGIWHCSGQSDPPEMGALFRPGRGGGMPPPSLALSVGEGGTIITSNTSFDRDTEWANTVVVTFTWKSDTSGLGRTGTARVTSGPFAVNTVGVVAATFEEERRYYVDQAVADARAGYYLSRTLNRGREIVLDAVAAYWLRPSDTVTVQLPLGPQERHTVRAVTYTLQEGRMSVRSYQPDTVSQITLGGG